MLHVENEITGLSYEVAAAEWTQKMEEKMSLTLSRVIKIMCVPPSPR